MSERPVALVTGGAQGIGKAITARLLERGDRVVIVDVDEAAGMEAIGAYAKRGPVEFRHADVAEESAVIEVMTAVEQRYGRLDLLVNNAAVSRRKPLQELTLMEWQRVLAVNLTGPFLCARSAAPLLQRAGGAIINIASTRALMSEPDTEAYGASKGGVVALTHALAASLAPVRVNCVSPGWIEVGNWQQAAQRRDPELSAEDHQQHWAGRVGRPEDIAAMVDFLSSPDAGFITGANFIADGGMTRKMIYAD